jgi:hypothetical protein
MNQSSKPLEILNFLELSDKRLNGGVENKSRVKVENPLQDNIINSHEGYHYFLNAKIAFREVP